jgi:hypothetical protein
VKSKVWTLTVNEHGSIVLPADLLTEMRRITGVKSKKRRIIKKAIKKLFMEALKEMLERNQPVTIKRRG